VPKPLCNHRNGIDGGQIRAALGWKLRVFGIGENLALDLVRTLSPWGR
jgi:hypothetical protein